MKKLTSLIVILIIGWTALAAFFTFTDWQISQALHNPASSWAHFMEAYGQVPGSFLGVLSAGILLRTYKVQKNIKSISGVIGLGVLAIFTSLGMSADLLGVQVEPENINPIALLVVTFTVAIVVQVILRRFSHEAVSRYKAAALAGLVLTFAAGFITVWAIKIPWGRWTYRDILEAGDPALFTPWYLPQGNNGHHSFISGHTALSFVVMGYLYFLDKGNGKKNILLAVFLLWGVIGALSRVVIGAHFASDVLFGAGETMLWFLSLAKRYQFKL